jgi:hypothetical protein
MEIPDSYTFDVGQSYVLAASRNLLIAGEVAERNT